MPVVTPMMTVAIALEVDGQCGRRGQSPAQKKVNAFAPSSRSNGRCASREIGREIATCEEARRIAEIGTWFSSAEETLLNLGRPPNRNGGRRGLNRRLGFPQGRRDSLTQLSSGVGLWDVSCLTDIKSGFHYLAVVVHCEEDYPRLRRFLPNHLGSFDPIQPGHTNIQNYDVRLQFPCFPDSFLPIGRFGDNLPFWMRRQDLANSRPPARGIIDDEDTRQGEMCHDSADSRMRRFTHAAFRLPKIDVAVFGQLQPRCSVAPDYDLAAGLFTD